MSPLILGFCVGAPSRLSVDQDLRLLEPWFSLGRYVVPHLAGRPALAVKTEYGPASGSVQERSIKAFSCARSLRFAWRIAAARSGVANLEKPRGSPRFLSVIRVPPSPKCSQV